MFEAFKIGITIALTNAVSSTLAGMSRDFLQTNAHAIKLQNTLKSIGYLKLGIAGVTVYAGAKLIEASIKPAMEYTHQISLMNAAGMKQVEVANAVKQAWGIMGEVPTTTPAENLAAIRELRMVFGNTQEAIDNLATVQKVQSILSNVSGRSGDEAYTLAKALEMKGAVKNPALFSEEADLMIKSIIASGGKVGPQDFLSAFKYGRSATLGWDEHFTYKILPTLIQEMKSAAGAGGSGGPGNALMSAYAEVVGGTITQKSLKTWEKLGLLDPSKVVWDKVGSAKGIAPGGIRGVDQFINDPYVWVQTYLMPALIKAGYTTEASQKQILQYLFPNRTAGFAMGQMALQSWKFQRDEALTNVAQGTDAYKKMLANDPVMAMKALTDQWVAFEIAFGKAFIPVMLPILKYATEFLNKLAEFTNWSTSGKTPSLVPGPHRDAAESLDYWKNKFFPSSESKTALVGAPPSGGKSITIDNHIHLDGVQLMDSVTNHLYDQTNAPQVSGSLFDGRMSYLPSAP